MPILSKVPILKRQTRRSISVNTYLLVPQDCQRKHRAHITLLKSIILYFRSYWHKWHKVSEEQISRLCHVDFVFSLQEQQKQPRWDVAYVKLVAYAKEHTNANVPQRYNQSRALCSWVKSQRAMFKRHRLSKEQVIFGESVKYMRGMAQNIRDLSYHLQIT